MGAYFTDTGSIRTDAFHRLAIWLTICRIDFSCERAREAASPENNRGLTIAPKDESIQKYSYLRHPHHPASTGERTFE